VAKRQRHDEALLKPFFFGFDDVGRRKAVAVSGEG
jgi:hypothetical protein